MIKCVDVTNTCKDEHFMNEQLMMNVVEIAGGLLMTDDRTFSNSFQGNTFCWMNHLEKLLAA